MNPAYKNSHMARRNKVIRDFRKYVGGARLYWKDKRPGWRFWDEPDIAMCRHKSGHCMAFTSLDEIEVYIIDSLKYPDDWKWNRDFLG